MLHGVVTTAKPKAPQRGPLGAGMQMRSFRTVMATLMVVLVTATVSLLLVVQAQFFRRSVMTLADRIMEQTLGGSRCGCSS